MSDMTTTLPPVLIADEIEEPEILPYPGLRPFREDETHLFFGREVHRRDLLKRMATTRFVAVIGTSGSGKSSLIRAGLLPDLHSGYLPKAGSDWIVIDMTPGSDPIGRMATKFEEVGWEVTADELRTNSTQILDVAQRHLHPEQQLFVLVDQFEEFFRLRARENPVDDHDEKASFVRLLLNAGGQAGAVAHTVAPRVHVIIAMRSEFLGRASTHRGLPEAIDQGQYLIPRLSRDQLRKAIECPIFVAAGRIEEALVQRLLNELGDDQDQLPILQHALMRSWDYWKRAGADGALNDVCYEKSGGFDHALSNDASEVLARTVAARGAEGERIVKRVFQSIRETDVSGGQGRRPTSVKELCEIAQCSRPSLKKALEPFRQRSFLLPPPSAPLCYSTLIDVSHEALLRKWSTLKGWIDEDDLERRLYVRIATRAADETGSKDPDYFVPPLLGVLQKFWNDRQPSRAWGVRHHPGYEQARDFLARSARHEDERERAHAKRARLKQGSYMVGGLLALALVVGSVSLMTSREQARLLEAQVVAAKAANAPDSDIETRIQLAAEALRREPAPDAQRLLLESILAAARPVKEISWAGLGAEEDAPRMALSAKGDVVFLAGDTLPLTAIDVATGAETLSVDLQRYDSEVLLTPTADGGRVFVLADPVSVLDAATGKERAMVNIAEVYAVAASYDGDTVAIADDSSVYVCSLANACANPARHMITDMEIGDVALSADGRMLAIHGPPADDKIPVALYDTLPWKRRVLRELPSAGEMLAMAIDRESLRLCSSLRLTFFDAYDDTLDSSTDVAFPTEASECRLSSDRAATLHVDRTLRVWDANGIQAAVAPARADILDIAVAGRRVVALEAQQIKIWEANRYGHKRDAPEATRFYRGGAYALAGTQLIDVESGTSRTLFSPLEPEFNVRTISDSLRNAVFWIRNPVGGGGPQLAYAELSESGGIGKWSEKWRVAAPSPGKDATGRERMFFLTRAPLVTMSIDGKFISVSTAGSGFVSILDARNGTTLIRIPAGTQLAFVPNSDELVVRERRVQEENGEPRVEERLAVWSVPRGRSRDLSAENARLDAAQVGVITFSPDGRLFGVAEAAAPGSNGDAGEKRAWSVRVWDWPALTLRHELQHATRVTALTFRGDSKALLAATTGATIHAWNLETGQEVARVPVSTQARVLSMAFTPSGQIAFNDGLGLTVIPNDPNLWIAEACRRISRDLSRLEWDVLVGPNVQYARTCFPNTP